MTKVLVLGGTGMLGSMIVDLLSRERSCTLSATVRDMDANVVRTYPNVKWKRFDAASPDDEVYRDQEWIVNAIGITKPLIRDDDPAQIERAIRVNAVFPHELARSGATVLQIATDCVYSGSRGQYTESDAHDALDVYGKTKSLGECYHPKVHNLRCSIIGPEPKDYKFLVEWFRRQDRGGTVKGYVNHVWNGLTTLHFARVCWGIISGPVSLPHIQHIVPSGCLSKAEMLHEFAAVYNRLDIGIQDVKAPVLLDRTLATNDASLNAQIWASAGYENAPSIADMIHELASYDYRAAGDAWR